MTENRPETPLDPQVTLTEVESQVLVHFPGETGPRGPFGPKGQQVRVTAINLAIKAGAPSRITATYLDPDENRPRPSTRMEWADVPLPVREKIREAYADRLATASQVEVV